MVQLGSLGFDCVALKSIYRINSIWLAPTAAKTPIEAMVDGFSCVYFAHCAMRSQARSRVSGISIRFCLSPSGELNVRALSVVVAWRTSLHQCGGLTVYMNKNVK